MEALLSFLNTVQKTNKVKSKRKVRLVHRRSQTQSQSIQNEVSSYDINQARRHKNECTKKQLKNCAYSTSVAFETNKKLGNFFLEYISRDQTRKQRSKIRKMKLSFDKESIYKNAVNKQNIQNKTNQGGLTKRLTCSIVKKVLSFNRCKSSILGGKDSQNFKSFQQNKQDLMVRKNKSVDFQLWKVQVRKICKCLQELKVYGSVDKKLDKWCLNYFDTKKRNLIDIFMKKIAMSRSLNNLIMFHVINNEEKLWNNIINAVLQMSQKQKYFLGIQISLYRGFLEQKISQKQKLQLNQIQNKVKNNIQHPYLKQFAKQLYQNSNNSTQLATFFSELHKIEEKYGSLQLVSLKNRKKFQNLNQSEGNIKKFVYNK